MKQWEYEVIDEGTGNPRELEHKLNTYGNEGWELVSRYTHSWRNTADDVTQTTMRWVFKRPKQ